MKIYDLHSHLGKTRSGEKNSAAQMVAEMSAYGIEKVGVCYLSGTGFKAQNDLVYAATQEFPNFIHGYADIDPKDPGAFDEVNRTLGEMKMKGVKFLPWKHGYHSENCPPLGAVLDEIGQYPVQVQVHVGSSPLTTPYVWIEHARKRPQMKFVFTHMGSRELGYSTVVAIKDTPNIFVETSAQENHEVLLKAVADLGTERIALGTDWPYKPINVEIEKLDYLGLSEAQYEDIYYKTAEYLWSV